jgi:hypothetical protein
MDSAAEEFYLSSKINKIIYGFLLTKVLTGIMESNSRTTNSTDATILSASIPI